MKSLLYTLLLIFTASSVFAQPDEGVIVVKNGYLLYHNLGENSYTLELDKSVKVDRLPEWIITNTATLQFDIVAKKNFGTEDKTILLQYRDWESDYLNEMFGTTLKMESNFLRIDGDDALLWSVMTPVDLLELEDTVVPVLKTFYLQRIHKDIIFRFMFPSTTGDNQEAEKILLDINKNLRFYNAGLNFPLLQNNIMSGKNFYEE